MVWGIRYGIREVRPLCPIPFLQEMWLAYLNNSRVWQGAETSCMGISRPGEEEKLFGSSTLSVGTSGEGNSQLGHLKPFQFDQLSEQCVLGLNFRPYATIRNMLCVCFFLSLWLVFHFVNGVCQREIVLSAFSLMVFAFWVLQNFWPTSRLQNYPMLASG